MDRLIYTSLTALRGAMSRQTATANNLANANTPGFRAEMADAQAFYIQGEGLNARAPQTEGVTGADMTAGAVASTGRDLDVSLSGDALLTVQATDGSEAYTRRGDLQLSDSGLLTTGDGAPVVGDQGPITLPPADKVKIDGTGAIWILPQGSQQGAEMQKVDQLKLVSPQGSTIKKGLDGLFREANGGTLAADPDARLTSGALEGSNVSTAKALTDMIQASRDWDTQTKMISAAKDIDSSGAQLMNLPSD
ncbi:MAG: flagellar basal body rod protein FlgF [Sphingomonadaceae bacterium]|nr:flagellar basal body rod protein FlgF [Sphingomonadaceae bacterium]